MQLIQCMKLKNPLSQNDVALLKQKEVEYCVKGYQSFRSVEHQGFLQILQTSVDLGVKHGRFDVGSVLPKRSAVSRETVLQARKMKTKIYDALRQPIIDGSVSLSMDLYTDDYRKKAYIDVHATWIDDNFTLRHVALAVRHFGILAHNGINIQMTVKEILQEYGLSIIDTPVTTDHGQSNVVAALRINVRLDCLCHRLHTVLEKSWKDTKKDVQEAEVYETAINDLCRYAKQTTGLQEQLPKSLKCGGDARPWISMFRRSESVDCSYEALVAILTVRSKLELIANVNRTINKK